MTPGCVVLLDDTIRADEREIATAWSQEWNLTLDLRHDYEKGLAILVAQSDSGERQEPN